MTDFELKDYKVGDLSISDMTGITFLGWVAGKLNGIEGHSPSLNELSMLVKVPPIGQIPLENKIDIIRKLEKLGVVI